LATIAIAGGTAHRAVNLRLQLREQSHVLQRLLEADAGGRATLRIGIRDRLRGKQHTLDRIGRRDVRLSTLPSNREPTATVASGVSLLLTT
jgi:hypothetical protein